MSEIPSVPYRGRLRLSKTNAYWRSWRCRNCKKDGLQRDKGFPAYQDYETLGRSQSCLDSFKSFPLRALRRPSVPALLYRRELRDPNGLLTPRSYSYNDLILDQKIPNSTQSKSRMTWLQPGDGSTPASEDEAARFQRFLLPAGFFDFHPHLFDARADGHIRHLCVKQCGGMFDTNGDLIDRCYPGSDTTTINTCRQRFHPACPSSVQFGGTCHYTHNINSHVTTFPQWPYRFLLLRYPFSLLRSLDLSPARVQSSA
jgi:hypothetical protein